MIPFKDFILRELGCYRFTGSGWFYFERSLLQHFTPDELSQLEVLDEFKDGAMMTNSTHVIIFYPKSAYTAFMEERERRMNQVRRGEKIRIEDELLAALERNDFAEASKISKRLQTITKKLRGK